MDRPSENVLYRLHMDSSTKRYAQLETYDTVMFQETEFVSIAQGLCAKRTTLLKEEVSSASNTANANVRSVLITPPETTVHKKQQNPRLGATVSITSCA